MMGLPSAEKGWQQWGGWLPWAACFLALATVLAAVAREGHRVWNAPPAERIDARYASVLPFLNDRVVGFVTDLDEIGDGEDYNYRFIEAQYAVAPRILVKGAAPRLVLADLNDPSELPKLMRRSDLILVHRSDRGVAVLMRSTR